MTTRVFADDLVLGVAYSAGSHRVSAEEIIDFARRWDPLPIHIDESAAAASPFGRLIASGIHSFGIYQRLTVVNVYRGWQIIAGRRVHDLEFPKPVFAGTTLHAFVRIDRVIPRGRGRSVVHKTGTLIDDEGDLVFRIRPQVYMWDRTSLPDST